MIQSITYETNLDELLNMKDVQNIINEYSETYKNLYNKTIKDPLEKEITSGGLDKFTINILGVAPANELAIETLDQFEEVAANLKTLKQKTFDDAKNQKRLELKKLLEQIDIKLKQLQIQQEKITNNVYASKTMSENYQSLEKATKETTTSMEMSLGRMVTLQKYLKDKRTLVLSAQKELEKLSI